MSKLPICPGCQSSLPADAPAGLCPSCLLSAAIATPEGTENAAALPESDRFRSPTIPATGRFVPPSVEQLTPLFPSLEIQQLIGYGGMGAIYRARQKKLDRLVALKIIRPEVQTDPAFAERFNREARTLARLSHPGIVAIHDFGDVAADAVGSGVGQSMSDQPLYFFVMEYSDGVNLRQLLNSGSLSAAEALRIVPLICDALQYAHDEGVVHRDIKPENILIDSRGRVKIADFGLAKLVSVATDEWTLTGTHQVMGTPRYMAPEQMEGSRSVDHRADIYSLGVVFYEMLTGQVPAGHFELPSQKAAVSPGIDAIVLRAMAREPERRFQRASELRVSVQSEADSASVSPSAKGPDSSRETSPAAQPMAFSEIFSREARDAARWIGGSSESVREHVAAPRWLMLLLAVTPCAMLFFPWFDIYVTDSEATRGLESKFLTVFQGVSSLHLSVSPLQLGTGIAFGVFCCVLTILQCMSLGRRRASRIMAILSLIVAAPAIINLLMHRAELYHWRVAVFADPITGEMPRNFLSFGRPPGTGDSYIGPLHHTIQYRLPFLAACVSLFLLVILLASELRHGQSSRVFFGDAPQPISLTRKMGRRMIAASIVTLISGIVTALTIFGLGSSVDTGFANLMPLQALCLISSSIGLVAGFQLLEDRQTNLAKTAAILILIPITPGWILTLPVAAWCLASLKVAKTTASVHKVARRTIQDRMAFWTTIASIASVLCFLLMIAASFLATATVTTTNPSMVNQPEVSPPVLLITGMLLTMLSLPVGIAGFVAAGNLRQQKVTRLVHLVWMLFLVPISPAWLISMPVGLWCLSQPATAVRDADGRML